MTATDVLAIVTDEPIVVARHEDAVDPKLDARRPVRSLDVNVARAPLHGAQQN